ncbi:TIGR03618 family F420-dependent PPOX class oxidoreductase [Actinoplanes sp. CA-252034]|uniref:TIGR03618 family F420-dependent PPOX class oxidoreductase n=1 Tax=Actinoplanes sp. CA-252034 TaxID=3239906 RepID=UPI003D956E83
MTTVDHTALPEDVTSLLSSTANAVVGINRSGRPPQLSVVWFLWDGETFRFSTTRGRAKYANLRRDPNISLLIDDPVRGVYLAAYGTAEIVEEGHAELAQPILDKYLPPEQARTPEWTPDRVRTGC